MNVLILYSIRINESFFLTLRSHCTQAHKKKIINNICSDFKNYQDPLAVRLGRNAAAFQPIPAQLEVAFHGPTVLQLGECLALRVHLIIYTIYFIIDFVLL